MGPPSALGCCRYVPSVGALVGPSIACLTDGTDVVARVPFHPKGGAVFQEVGKWATAAQKPVPALPLRCRNPSHPPERAPPPPPPKMGPFEQRWLSNNSNLLSVSGA